MNTTNASATCRVTAPSYQSEDSPRKRRLGWKEWGHNDWLADKALLACSRDARSAWIGMLAFAFESVEQGFILPRGAAGPDAHVAKILGGDPAHNLELIAELERHGVFSRDNRGVIYSRHIVRDVAAAGQQRTALGQVSP